jgi:transcriptional regulator with XRE-family HTH domain
MAAAQEAPAVARRRVRLALRKAREASGLNQSAVAQRLGWSLSKIQRIELGEVTVSGTDLRAVLSEYGVADDPALQGLYDDVRTARRERWWTAQEHREHLSAGLRQLIQFETAASTIRVFQPVLVPGLLQTSELSEAVLGWWDVSLTDDERRIRSETRIARRWQVVERRDAPLFCLMLDESVLLRLVGGPRVMADQLDVLIEIAKRPNVHIRILPLDKGAFIGSFGPFMILNLDESDSEDAVLYRESDIRDEVTQETGEVLRHRSIFEAYWTQSLDEHASLLSIIARAADLKAQLARQESESRLLQPPQ